MEMQDNLYQIYGVLGYPLRHSMSPMLHNLAYKIIGFNGIYTKFETQDLHSAIVGVRALGVKGLSVTIPYKIDIIPYLDYLDPMANKIGAVNTVINRDGKLYGYNTDATGSIKAISEVIDPSGTRILIIGAGGSARALAVALSPFTSHIYIINRHIKKAQELAAIVNCNVLNKQDMSSLSFDLVINTTPIGMFPNNDEIYIDPTIIQSNLFMDIVYNPLVTKFLKIANEKGAKIIPGYKMFLFQAAEQIRMFTGVEPPLQILEESLIEELNKYENNP